MHRTKYFLHGVNSVVLQRLAGMNYACSEPASVCGWDQLHSLVLLLLTPAALVPLVSVNGKKPVAPIITITFTAPHLPLPIWRTPALSVKDAAPLCFFFCRCKHAAPIGRSLAAASRRSRRSQRKTSPTPGGKARLLSVDFPLSRRIVQCSASSRVVRANKQRQDRAGWSYGNLLLSPAAFLLEYCSWRPEERGTGRGWLRGELAMRSWRRARPHGAHAVPATLICTRAYAWFSLGCGFGSHGLACSPPKHLNCNARCRLVKFILLILV